MRRARVPKSDLYDALEPLLNARQVVLLDVPELESQLLGLVWRGGKIDHPSGEHDDYANAVAGVVSLVATSSLCEHCGLPTSACGGLHCLPYEGPWLGPPRAGSTGTTDEAHVRDLVLKMCECLDAGDDAGADAIDAEIERFVASAADPDRLRALLDRYDKAFEEAFHERA